MTIEAHTSTFNFSAGVPAALQAGSSGEDARSAADWNRRAHQLIPGGCHTYAKGDDQYPQIAPPFLVEGKGCRVRDVDGNQYIEYGSGLRSVTLGHAYPEVVEAASREIKRGNNFVRPSTLEVECAESFLGCVTRAEMVKFAKNGSDATTAAVKLARACTGRDLVAICGDHPFFSVDDWFIGSTAMDAGIPEAIKRMTVKFHYNNLDSLREVFQKHPDQIACVILEGATSIEPEPGFLPGVRQLCSENGTLMILDEIITGFRWDIAGAQQVYEVTPDLSTFGKALANGFSLAALAGKAEFMRRGGLHHSDPRVFLLSTTYGAEHHSLAAAVATMEVYRRENVTERLASQGTRLKEAVNNLACQKGLDDFFHVLGRPCNLIFVTKNPAGQRSQEYRTLFMQEIIRRGVIAPSFVVNFSHDDDAIDQTIEAVDGALDVYVRALDDGVNNYLAGNPVKPVFRKYN